MTKNKMEMVFSIFIDPCKTTSAAVVNGGTTISHSKNQEKSLSKSLLER